MGVGTPPLSVTFDLYTPPPLARQRPSSPVQSVNEVEEPGGMTDTVLLEERLSVCERLLIVYNIHVVVELLHERS